jgi:hypothetical protein
MPPTRARTDLTFARVEPAPNSGATTRTASEIPFVRVKKHRPAATPQAVQRATEPDRDALTASRQLIMKPARKNTSEVACAQ